MKFRKRKEVVIESLGDECILIPKENEKLEIDKCIYLDGLGNEIWSMIQEHPDTEEIVQLICGKYNAEEYMVREDVESILCTFVKVGIMEEL